VQKRIGTWNPTRAVWETDSLDLFSELSEPFSETWPTWGITRSGVAFELPTRAHRMDGSASSLLRTPAAAEAEGGPRNPDREGATMRLSDQVREEQGRGVMLPTPTTDDAGNLTRSSGCFQSLTRTVTQLLPTPAAMNPNDGEGIETWKARWVKHATKESPTRAGMPLAIAVQTLPTGDTTAPPSNGGNEPRDD
jgi:hypothetical protein